MNETTAKVKVQFPKRFPATPNVVISMNMIEQVSPGKYDMYGWRFEVTEASKTGFTANLVGVDRKINKMGASWVACY